MRGRIKISTAIIMMLILIASIVLPTLKVFATTYTYTITFTVDEGTHTLAAGNAGEVVIDGAFVNLRDDENQSVGGVAVISNNGQTATITVTNGNAGTIGHGPTDKFTLFVGDAPCNFDAVYNQDTTILIKNHVDQNNNPGGGNNNGFEQPTTPGLYVRGLRDAGNIDYKFSGSTTFTTLGVPGGQQIKVDIPTGTTNVTVKGEDRTIGHVSANVSATQININKDTFRTENGVSFDMTPTDIVILEVEYMEGENPGSEPETNVIGNPDSNFVSNVTISGNRYLDVRMGINNTSFDFRPIESLGESYESESLTRKVHYKVDNSDETVTMFFATLFIQKFVGSITINDEDYPVNIDYTNREDWLDHYDRQCIGIELTVPKSANYNIIVNVTEQPGEYQYIGNFLWTADILQEFDTDEQGNLIIDPDTGMPRKNDNYIGHSKLQLIKMVYERDGHEIEVDFTDQEALDEGHIDLGEQDQGPGRFYHNFSDGNFEYGYKTKENNQAVTYDEGSLVVPEGAMVTMKIVPEYGYQVNSFGVNGNNIITGDNISEFTFEVGKGNYHLGAQVERVGNDVATGEDTGIKSGTVEIANDVLDEGTARLFVENNDDVSEEKASEFKEAAKDYLNDGYEISNYLDISLAQVFYKGNKDNVWVADELEDTHAKMTLQLENENFDPETTAIIHNVKDGDEFEKVDFTYDADTNSIEMESDTFSTFAIVSKTKVASTDSTKTDAINTPKTGDNIMIFASVFIVAVVVYIAITIKRHNIKISKKH